MGREDRVRHQHRQRRRRARGRRLPLAVHDASAQPPDSFIFNNGQVTSLDDENLLIFQTYDLTRVRNGNRTLLLDDAPVVPVQRRRGLDARLQRRPLRRRRGDVGGISSWVGQSDDPFFLDLRVFDLLYGADFGEAGDDTLDGFNVNTMVLQVPKSQLRGPTTA